MTQPFRSQPRHEVAQFYVPGQFTLPAHGPASGTGRLALTQRRSA
jgi:hypothetical protein